MDELFNNPELVRQLSEMGLFGDQQELLTQQMGRAQALRNAPAAGGRTVRDIYVAGGPLEHLSAGLSGIMGQKGIRDTSGQQNALIQRMRENAMALAQALRGQGQAPATSPMMPPGEY